MSGKSSASQSQSEQYVKRSLIPEGDLASIAKNDCYLFVSGLHPMKLQKAWQSEVFGSYVQQHTSVASEPSVKQESAFTVPTPPEPKEEAHVASGGATTHVIEEEIDQSELFDLTDDGLEEEWAAMQEEETEERSIEDRLKEKEATDLRTLL